MQPSKSMDKVQYLVFRVPPAAVSELFRSCDPYPELNPRVVDGAAGADGGGELTTVLVTLAPHVLTFGMGVATAWISRPGASVEYDGIKITNASRKLVEDIARRHLGLPPTSSDVNPEAEKK
jgi:hypothetical protein